ncbi:MAG: 16S rRNA (cytosine(1402)-N(4))-methyltransferase RsmH [Myxococcota bacterium]
MQQVPPPSSPPAHVPVMLQEAMQWLALPPGGCVVDCTLGRGGHSRELATRLGAGGLLLALDRDPQAHTAEALAWTREVACRVVTVQRPFSEVESVLREHGVASVHGLLADLGVSSPQLDDPARGFSFQAEGPLDMRMDPTSGDPAWVLVARLSERELADVIYELGEERHSRRVARALKEAAPRTTRQAAEVISRVVPRSKDGLHPATRTFQALRLAVNHEMDELDALLAAVPRVLGVGGRAVLISFHSLEDRKVKHAFQQEEKGCICPPRQPACTCGRWPRLEVLTRKPITPSDEEIARNPRARSAKLRAATRVADPEGKVATW